MPIYIPEHMTLPTQVHVSKNGSAMSSGHLSIQQEGEQEWHWADVWASTQHLPTIPWQGHPLETNTILLPYPQVLSSRTRSPTHKAIFRMEPEEKKVHPPFCSFSHSSPHSVLASSPVHPKPLFQPHLRPAHWGPNLS